MEVLNNLTVHSIRSDNGTEFKNNTLDQFFEEKGISQNFSSVRTPQQNGVAERRNRTLIEAARSMLSESNLATQFWTEAVNTASFTQNRSLIVKRFKKTAYELFRGRKPSISFLHIFGCKCYILNNRNPLGKFDPKADKGIFLGYSSSSYSFRVFNKRRQTIEETIHVNFDESNSANPNSFQENEELNQWADSYFSIPEPPIADPSPSAETQGEEETVSAMPTPDSDPSSSTISVTPLNQAAPSSTETSSSVNIDAALQSESVPETEINLVPSVTEVSST